MTPNPEDSRYRIYVVRDGAPVELARTSRDGIGLCLVTLRAEEEFTGDDAVGILDRLHDGEIGVWLVNPYGKAEALA